MEQEGFFTETLLFFELLCGFIGLLVGAMVRLESTTWDDRLLERGWWLVIGTVIGLIIPAALKFGLGVLLS
jgi:hypothetical protein